MSPNATSSWLVDHVIGTFTREGLSTVLAATHRAGFGPHTRVLDGARANVVHQLERTGLYVAADHAPPPDAILVVVTAPGRTAIVSDLFTRLGAQHVSLASRHPEPMRESIAVDLIVPDIRIGSDPRSGDDVR